MGSSNGILVLGPVWRRSLRKQPTFGDATAGFLAKWRLRNKRRNSVLMTHHYPDLGILYCFLLVVPHGKFDSANQKHYPDLGSDTSSVWNFCTRFSDVIWQGNQYMVVLPNVSCFNSQATYSVQDSTTYQNWLSDFL